MVPFTDNLTLRSLAYLRAVKHGGAVVSPWQLNQYAGYPEPGVGSLFTMVSRLYVVGGVDMANYLSQIGWAELGIGTIRITELGEAVLTAAGEVQAVADPAEPLEIVVRPEDPFTYVQMLREIGKLDDVLVIDPYIPSVDLEALAHYPNVKRVLTIDAGAIGEMKAPIRRQNLANVLGATGHAIELRVDKSRKPKRLHDRVMIPSRGMALQMGASLGALQPTALVHLSESTTNILRERYEEIWASSDVIEPAELPRGKDLDGRGVSEGASAVEGPAESPTQQ